MKKITVILILLIISKLSFSQALSSEYLRLIKKADSLYLKKEYKQSAYMYSAAFKANKWKAATNDRYDAACSWALAGVADSAFFNLQRIATLANYSNYDHISKDPDLTPLHSHPRWQSLLIIIQSNKKKLEQNLNKPLADTLSKILQTDQKCRKRYKETKEKFGANSPQANLVLDTMWRTDSINIKRVTAILDKEGWLGPDKVGTEGSLAIFLVIQHTDIKTQEKYLPLMREAVKLGKANAANLALLEDRILVAKTGKQKYGSQIGWDAQTQTYYIFPIEDEENVNKRRTNVGLQPLEEYAKQWNIIYKPPKKEN